MIRVAYYLAIERFIGNIKYFRGFCGHDSLTNVSRDRAILKGVFLLAITFIERYRKIGHVLNPPRITCDISLGYSIFMTSIK